VLQAVRVLRAHPISLAGIVETISQVLTAKAFLLKSHRLEQNSTASSLRRLRSTLFLDELNSTGLRLE
jgi:hypothetical protein